MTCTDCCNSTISHELPKVTCDMCDNATHVMPQSDTANHSSTCIAVEAQVDLQPSNSCKSLHKKTERRYDVSQVQSKDSGVRCGLRAMLRSCWLGAQVLVHEVLPHRGGHGGLSIPLIHLKPPLLLQDPNRHIVTSNQTHCKTYIC